MNASTTAAMPEEEVDTLMQMVREIESICDLLYPISNRNPKLVQRSIYGQLYPIPN